MRLVVIEVMIIKIIKRIAIIRNINTILGFKKAKKEIQ